MDEMKLLEAIGKMMDEKLAVNSEQLRAEMKANSEHVDAKIEQLRADLRTEMKENSEQLRADLRTEMKENSEQLRADLRTEMKENSEQLRADLRTEMKENSEQLRAEIMLDFNAVIEQKVSKEIRLIAEQHGDIIARLPDVDELSELKGRVCVLEHAVTDLNGDVDQLKKAQ